MGMHMRNAIRNEVMIWGKGYQYWFTYIRYEIRNTRFRK